MHVSCGEMLSCGSCLLCPTPSCARQLLCRQDWRCRRPGARTCPLTNARVAPPSPHSHNGNREDPRGRRHGGRLINQQLRLRRWGGRRRHGDGSGGADTVGLFLAAGMHALFATALSHARPLCRRHGRFICTTRVHRASCVLEGPHVIRNELHPVEAAGALRSPACAPVCLARSSTDDSKRARVKHGLLVHDMRAGLA